MEMQFFYLESLMEIGCYQREESKQVSRKKEAALREVLEETGVKAEILKYLGEIHYTYKENWDENKAVHKTVFWYLMKSRNMDTVPLKEEGFVDAKFIHLDRVVDLARYNDEREIIKVALEEIKKRN